MEFALISRGEIFAYPVAGVIDQTVTITPFEQTRSEWASLVNDAGSSRLYHSERWLEVLHNSYGFSFFTALLRSAVETHAGCIFARAKFPFARRMIALPFSDACEPLATDKASLETLLAALAATKISGRSLEIRGTRAPSPWITLDWFVNWELDLTPPASELYKRLSPNFRRNILKAKRAGVSIEHGVGLDELRRFCSLNVNSRRRLGLPSQPSRFFRNALQEFSRSDDVQIWLASRAGKDIAAIFLITHNERIYYKWSARDASDYSGSGHLLVWSIIEQLAASNRIFDLGRCDIRNQGLARFKRELGASSAPLPCSFTPHVPKVTSSEQLSGISALASRVWRHLPLVLYEPLSAPIYRYLA